MDRVILHSDCNCFYASVEMLHHPELDGKPLAVGGDPEQRHGIILTANYIAKRAGVKTGTALWEARQVCPELVIVPPRMDLYLRFSELARAVYREYSDLVEPYGLDECWIDCTGSVECFGSGLQIAREISDRIRRELGITVSIGVSWNKIFAKFGSDYRKPDAITVVSRDNYRKIVWESPVEDLLFVGRATRRKLLRYGILTIGELAQADPSFLHGIFGKMGLVLSAFARGEDRTPVSADRGESPIKSIGNSTTTPRDLTTEQDVRMVMYMLSESVASRLRNHGFVGDVVEICVRDSTLSGFSRQHRIDVPTNISEEIAQEGMRLFRENYDWKSPIRSIGVRVSHLKAEGFPWQLSIFTDPEWREKQLRADLAVDEIRNRFGYEAVRRGLMQVDTVLSADDAQTHVVHPHGYFEKGNRTGV
ncbi:MAG TPA: DNA polymerase IV [Lachnospiraceae bacterium]|nr:DNA polymerase IV [Lachnospiraceae bacterium]